MATAPKKITAKPPRQRTNARIPTGPSLYRQPRKPIVHGGPGDPPPGFLDPTLHGSATEWLAYWAIWRALGVKPNDAVRLPPFTGAPDGSFLYQSWKQGGRSRALGAVVDFEIPNGFGRGATYIRIQTTYFHFGQGPRTISADDLQKQRLSRDARVIDAVDSDFVNLDAQGLVIYFKQLLGGIDRIDPVRSGRFRPVQT